MIGPNGSGNSTLFNDVTGLIPADSGDIGFAGEEIGRLRSHQVAELRETELIRHASLGELKVA